MIITLDFLHDNAAARTPRGSTFTVAQLRVLGLGYPLARGWMRRVVGQTLTDKQAEQFIQARTIITKADRHQIRGDMTRKHDYSLISPEFLAAMDRARRDDRTGTPCE